MIRNTSIRTAVSGVCCAALGFTLFEGILPAEAKPAPKIEICHFQDENGSYEKLTVGANAWAAHAAHGDHSADTDLDCDPLTPHRFAVAYINMNGDSDFDEHDILIAELVNANGNFIPDAGDIIRTSQYPLSMSDICSDPSDPTIQVIPTASFRIHEHIVNDMYISGLGTWITAESGNQNQFHWNDSVGGAGGQDLYAEYNSTTGGYVIIQDAVSYPRAQDVLQIDTDSTSKPTTSVPRTTKPTTSDVCFVDVRITLHQ